MHPTDAPNSPLLAKLKAQLDQVRSIDLVYKVYLSPDQQTVVVEIHINPSLGLKHRNILFFPVEGFLIDQVYKSIARLKYVASRSDQAHAGGARLANAAHRRKLVL